MENTLNKLGNAKPETFNGFYASVKLNPSRILVDDSKNLGRIIGWDAKTEIDLSYDDLMDILNQWCEAGVKAGKLTEQVEPKELTWNIDKGHSEDAYEYARRAFRENSIKFTEKPNGQFMIGCVNFWATTEKFYNPKTGYKGKGMDEFLEYLIGAR